MDHPFYGCDILRSDYIIINSPVKFNIYADNPPDS